MGHRKAQSDIDAALEQRLLMKILSNEVLEIILMPTEQCNLRCVYCYEDFIIKHMPPHVVTSVKHFINSRLCDISQLHISWFGGEPLLAKNIIFDIGAFAVALCRDKPDLQLTSDMTTNAVLLDLEDAEALIRLKISAFQVSLDGPQHHHDKTRIKANGGGTFAKIWKNLLALRDSSLPFKMTLRVHVLADNQLSLEQFVDTLANEFGKDERFRLFLKPIAHLGGVNDLMVRIVDPKSEATFLNELYSRYQSASGGRTAVRDPGDPYVCYAARANSFVVRANGRVRKMHCRAFGRQE